MNNLMERAASVILSDRRARLIRQILEHKAVAEIATGRMAMLIDKLEKLPPSDADLSLKLGENA